MPELPEVETMVRGLRPALEGRVIRSLRVLDSFLLHDGDTADLERGAAGARVESIVRRGKWVVFHLNSDRGSIVVQPRMTGGFWLVPPPRMDHARLIFEVRGRRQPIWFCDTRRLGRVCRASDAKAAEALFARSHGPDALEIERDDLAARLRRTTRAIKPALMDQKVVAGIGNIYADEILFESRIHPEVPASRLNASDFDRLHPAVGAVLRRAIEAEGSTFDAGYRTVLGLEGGFLAINAMYGRGGQPCPACGGPILKTRIAGLIGRPTHYCERCQPLRRIRGRSGRAREDQVE